MNDSYNASELVVAVRKIHPDVEGIVLVGSLARGDEHSLSDIDLICLGSDVPEYELSVWGPRLLALQGKSHAQVQADFLDPAICAQAVPSWRTARILHDPDGVAASLQAQANAWDWPLVQPQLETWSAKTVTDFAEEAMKLVAAVRDHKVVATRVQAHLIVVHLTPAMAAVHHVLFASENALWDGTAGEGRWYEALDRVLQLDPHTAARAAIRLYLSAAEATHSWMNATQRAVVELVQRRAEEVGM